MSSPVNMYKHRFSHTGDFHSHPVGLIALYMWFGTLVRRPFLTFFKEKEKEEGGGGGAGGREKETQGARGQAR